MSTGLGAFARFIAVALGLVGLVFLVSPPAVATGASTPSTRPAAIVALGDSITSGEGGGDYEPGGSMSHWCHRSANAQVQHAKPAGVRTAVVLACSGAGTESVRLAGSWHYGEPPQAEQLKSVARSYEIRSIVLTIGANDIPVVGLAAECAARYFSPLPGCAEVWRDRLPRRLAEIQPRVEGNLRDIRTVMRDAGYPDDSYDLILQSYASPSSGRLRYGQQRRALEGCPFKDQDIAWVHDALFPEISGTMARAAAAVPGVRFLDIAAALDGRQVCAAGIEHTDELSWGLFFDPDGLRDGPGPQLVSQSLHPNAAGYRELARCLRDFHVVPARSARCERSGDDVSIVTSPATGP